MYCYIVEVVKLVASVELVLRPTPIYVLALRTYAVMLFSCISLFKGFHLLHFVFDYVKIDLLSVAALYGRRLFDGRIQYAYKSVLRSHRPTFVQCRTSYSVVDLWIMSWSSVCSVQICTLSIKNVRIVNAEDVDPIQLTVAVI